MGWKLVFATLTPAWARHLTPSARTLHTYMAARALDNDKPPRYWAGHEELAAVLDGYVHDPGPKRNAQLRRVRRLLEQMVEAGAIAHLAGAAPGRNAEYEIRAQPLKLEGRNSPTSTVSTQGRNDPMTQGRNSPTSDSNVGQKQPPTEGKNNPPEEEAGVSKEQELVQEDMNHLPSSPHLGARETAESDDDLCTICRRDEAAHLSRTIRGAHRFTPARAVVP